ncbi:MAG: FtsK/SpoIIIE domain-containing protein [Oscillospiraceae bacterium]|nr:FtsK/SpoIIIE domain-containing protein [Oscillospiraceae bacterium]
MLTLPLSSEGNVVVFGNAESGKENLLSTIVYDIVTNHSSEEAQLYLLDFGTESLKIFGDCPHVGDVVYINDTEKINRLFEMIEKEIKKRKDALSEYNGDYGLYIKTSDEPMPEIIVVINNFEAFSENHGDKYEDILMMLTREATKYGIKFIFTASTSGAIRYRMAQNFKQKIALQLNNQDDFISILEGVRKEKTV